MNSKTTRQSSLTRQILLLALPIVLENLLQALLGTVDTWFAGRLDDAAIAAIGATTLVVNLFLSFYTAISVGTSAIIARYTGEKNNQKVNHAAGQSVLMALFLGILIGAIAFVFQNPILTLSGAEDAIREAAKPYYNLVAVPSVFACLTLVFSACLRASKDTVTPMLVSGASNILNIILDAVFLMLGMGIAGLALATTLSRMLAALVLFLRLSGKRNGIQLSRSSFKPNRQLLINITRISIPVGIERLLMRIGQLIYNGLIFQISTNAYVAHSVAGTIEYYSYIPAMGFSAAASTLVGISLGEKEPEKARKITWKTWLLANAFMIPIGIVYFVASPMLVAQFTETADVQNQAIQVLRLIAFFQPVIAFSNVFAGALQGASDTKYPMYTTFFGTWVVHIGLGYLLGVKAGLGLFGIWIAYALNDTTKSILLYLRFRTDKWTKIHI